MECENGNSMMEGSSETKECSDTIEVAVEKENKASVLGVDTSSQNDQSGKSKGNVQETVGDVAEIARIETTVVVDSLNNVPANISTTMLCEDENTEKFVDAVDENIVANDTKTTVISEQTTDNSTKHVDSTTTELPLSIASESLDLKCNTDRSSSNEGQETATDQSSRLDGSKNDISSDTGKTAAISGVAEGSDRLETTNQMDTQAANVDSNTTAEHPTLTVGKSSKQTMPKSKTSKSQNASDDKALNENISSKTMELMESMDMDNCSSTSKSAKACTNKLHIKREKNLQTTGLGLSLLAQYNSESDADCEGDDDVMEVPIEANKDYRNRVVEIMSESESESSSSDDSDVEYLTTIRKEIEKSIDLDDDEDDDEDNDADGAAGGNKKKKQSQMRVKGELLLEDLPPIQDLHITVPENECIELGRIHSIINQLLLVSVLPDSLLLDLDTVLFLDKGKKVLGEVFDVLGQVADPMYCVRFNSHKEIDDKGIKIGDIVYVAPKTQYTQFVILSSLMNIRGSDASWENDVEPPPRYIDYSDDEQEREARTRLRNKDRPNDHENPIKRSRSNGDESTASSSSKPSNSQTQFTQRTGRFNQERSDSVRSPYQYQRYQAPPSVPHTGSWHSNFRQPYSSYNNVQRGPPYQTYSPGPYPLPPPQMSPIPSPAPPPMYVLNPMAVNPPRMFNNGPQYHAPQPRRNQTHSPPPAPPGLD